MPVSDYDPVFQAAGQEWNVDPTLLKAMAHQESGGNPRAVSRKGAAGVMGIMPGTASDLGVDDPTDPVQSIYGGAKYMRQMLDKYGSPERALAAYNAGPERMDAVLAGKAQLPDETRAYLPAVQSHYQRFGKQDAQPAGGAAQQKPAAAPSSSAVPSDDEFLKQTASPTGQTQSQTGAVPSDDEFMASTGAKAGAAQPIEPLNPDAGANEYGITSDPQQFNQQKAGLSLDAPGRIASEAAAGAKAGFGSEPLGISEQTRNRLAEAGIINKPGERNPLKSINEAAIGGVAAGGDLALRTGNALVGGYQRGISQAGAEIGQPGLGRDLAALPEAFPTGDTGGGTRIPGPQGAVPTQPQANPLAAVDRPYLTAQAADAIEANGGNALSPRMLAPGPSEPVPGIAPPPGRGLPAASPQSEAGPSPGMGGAAGAQASTAAEAQMTPDEIAANRSRAERDWLNQKQQAGVSDNRVLVPGVTPTLAQMEQKVTTARELKNLRNLNTEVSDEERAVKDEHNQRRNDFFNSPELASNEVDYNNGVKARDDKIEAALGEAWANKKPADPSGITTQIDTELGTSAGKLPPVKSAMRELTDALQKADGSGLETDPEQIYGVRRLINYMQSKTGQRAVPAYGNGDLQRSLVRIKQAVDAAIEPAAPGFSKAIADYATESHRLDAMAALQKAEPALYDANGSMQYSRVHALMTKIIAARRPEAAVSPWQGLNDGQMGMLRNLHDDLRRVASAQDLERAHGSDTVPNAVDAAKDIASSGGHFLAHGAATYAFGPGTGSLILGGVRSALEPITGRIAAGRRMRRGMEMLYPDPAKYPTRNALDPNAPP